MEVQVKFLGTLRDSTPLYSHQTFYQPIALATSQLSIIRARLKQEVMSEIGPKKSQVEEAGPVGFEPTIYSLGRLRVFPLAALSWLGHGPM